MKQIASINLEELIQDNIGKATIANIREYLRERGVYEPAVIEIAGLLDTFKESDISSLEFAEALIRRIRCQKS